ncbi:MAG TPA: radical SAM protein [Methanofastidiosum sp.]|nr:radical SAM protein [Methanofastidiosum sp.]HNU61394.1 radical SAM protein [Methanofastidiosum sp.]
MTIVELDIDYDKVYSFPNNLYIKHFLNKYIVVSPSTGNWLVFSNYLELSIFNMIISKKNVSELHSFVSKKGKKYENSLINVLTQIEAKRFYNQAIRNHEGINLYIYLTNKCNLNCPQCYMYTNTKRNISKELDLDPLFNIINDFKECGGTNITFSGGEPSLRNDLVAILKKSKNKGIKNTVLTNGTYWKDEMIEEAAKYIDELQISIDGYDEESNSKTRGQGNFSKAFETLDKFYVMGTKVSIAVTPLYENIDLFIKRYEKFAKENILKKYDEKVMIRFSLELIKGRNVELTQKQNDEYYEKLKELANKLYPNFYINAFACGHYNNLITRNCGYGEITINSNGDIYFCNRIYEIKKYNNINEVDFEELFSLSNSIKEITSVDNIEPCRHCELKYICGGGCRIKYLSSLDFEDITNNFIVRNGCSEEYKNKFYKIMIDCNELMYLEE